MDKKKWAGSLLKNSILTLALSSLGTLGAGFSINRYENSLLGIDQPSYGSIFIAQFIFIFAIIHIISGVSYVISSNSAKFKIIFVISCVVFITAVLIYTTLR